MDNKHTISDLKQMQSLPLSAKIRMTEYRIREWVDEYGEDSIYVSFSGGKDSTVLLDIVRKIYPRAKAVFIDTGLEYPKIREFVKTFDNVDIIRPKMNFREVLIKYGYPVISKEIASKTDEVRKSIAKGNTNTVRYRQFLGLEKKDNGEPSEFNTENYKYLLNAPFQISDRCCEVMKKAPAHIYNNKMHSVPIIAVMAEESIQRRTKWIKNGCNAFNLKHPESNPMSFWTENDVLTYIHENSLPIAEPYGQVIVKGTENGQMCIQDMIGDYEGCQFCTTGCRRTGCVFCGFAINQDKERFVRLKEQEPKLADYVLRGGEFAEDGMWQPSSGGLGFWFVLEWLNAHGNLHIVIPDKEHYRQEYGNLKTEELLRKTED